MTRIAIVLAFALALPLAAAGQIPGVRGQARSMQQRQALEQQIIRRFVEQTGRELALESEARTRLEQILQQSNERRRALVAASANLRRQLAAAIREPGTEDTRFQALLAEARQLRKQEHDLWELDHAEIARTLTPRQQAIFALRWIRFQERIQQMIQARGGRGGPARDTLR